MFWISKLRKDRYYFFLLCLDSQIMPALGAGSKLNEWGVTIKTRSCSLMLNNTCQVSLAIIWGRPFSFHFCISALLPIISFSIKNPAIPRQMQHSPKLINYSSKCTMWLCVVSIVRGFSFFFFFDA